MSNDNNNNSNSGNNQGSGNNSNQSSSLQSEPKPSIPDTSQSNYFTRSLETDFPKKDNNRLED